MIDHDWMVLRDMARIIARLAAQVGAPGRVALDFGCGSRPYEPLFRGAGCAYRGADFGGEAEVLIDAEGRLHAPDHSADLVLSFQVLEHVRDLATYFAEARRVLRPGGTMVLSTHGTWLYHPHPEDHRRWTRQGLIGDIQAHGFDVAECHPVLGPLAWTTLIRLTCWCYALKRLPVIGVPLSWLMSLIMNLRAMVEEAVTPAWVREDNACVYVTVCRPAEAAAC
ncbi:MAG: class I SAM-dependent methyltransferase [Caulobacterales bacterium]